MSVDYLTPGQGVWAQRASEGTLDLIEDPFWRVRQNSIASKDGILWRCSNSFLELVGVERSVDGGITWLDVTPTNDPPDDNMDSSPPAASELIYTHIDGSRVAQGTFAVVANWQAGVPCLGCWRSWLAITEDDGVTWVWKSLTPPDDPDVTIHLAQEINPIPGNTYPGVEVLVSGPSGCVVVGSGVESTFSGLFSLFSYSGTTATPEDSVFQTPYLFNGLVKLSPTRIATVERHSSFTGRWRMKLWGIDAGCTTITELDFAEVPLYSGLTAGFGMTPIACGFTDRCLLISREDWAWDYAAHQVDFTGDTITFPGSWGDWWEGDPVESRNAPIFMGSAVVGPGSVAILTWHPFLAFPLDDGRHRVTVVEYGTSAPTHGDNYVVDDFIYDDGQTTAGRFCLRHMEGNKYVAAYTGQPFGAPNDDMVVIGLNISGTVVTSGTPYKVGKNDFGTFTHPIVLDKNWVHILSDSHLHTVVVNDALEVIPKDTPTAHGVNPSGSHGGVLLDYDGEIALWASVYSAGGDTDITFFETDLEPGSTGEARGYGVSIGKQAGEIIWVTLWDEGDIAKLVGVEVSSLTFGQNIIELGPATLASLGPPDKEVRPFAFYGSDKNVVAYGRMLDPQGLGFLPNGDVHIAYTLDGVTLIAVENRWGASHCGALFVLPNGWVYAVRDDFFSSRFYFGTLNGLTIQSVIPFQSGVEQHGLAVDFRDGAIVACAALPNPYMIAVSAYPYTTWSNVTGNHGTALDVFAVTIL